MGIPDDSTLDFNGEGFIESILDNINELVKESGRDNEINKPEEPAVIGNLEEQGFIKPQIQEIEAAVTQNLPFDKYINKKYNWMQMRELRLGLMRGLDVELYDNPFFAFSQMREIRYGLEDDLDVTSYAKQVFSASDMKKIRRQLFAAAYKNNPNAFAKEIVDEYTGIKIRINKDCLSAYITIPDKGDSMFSAPEIINLLEDYGINYGLKKELIIKASEGKYNGKEICIAVGKKPITGKPGYYEIFFENPVDRRQFVAPDDEIDYSAVNMIESARPGMVLAEYHPAEKDVDGVTVTGIVIEGTVGKELPTLSGFGFEFIPENNTYVATTKGYVSYNASTGRLSVSDIYIINGDITYYQSVEYDGSIHVFGSVRNMAKVNVKGNIIVDGYVEGAFIEAGQDVIIKGGVNGGSQGFIHAKGSIHGKFFENAVLRSGGQIDGNYFLNCDVVTEDKITVHGKKARILGGTITAAISIDAVVVGNYMGSRTRIQVGDNPDLDEHISDLTRQVQKISDEIMQLTEGKNKLLKLLGDKAAGSNPLYIKTQSAIIYQDKQLEDLNKELSRLMTISKRTEKAFLKVRKEVQEGVFITINGSHKSIMKTITNGITLTKEKRQEDGKL